MPRYDADWIDSMLQPERRGAEEPAKTIARLGLRDGQVVADVGCGPGYITLPAARAVAPNGTVHAIDREPRMLAIIRERAETAGITNLIVTRAEETIPLADQSVDLAFCSLVLHDLADPARFVRDLIRVTRPNGRVAIVEWLPEADDPRPNRISPDKLTALFAGTSVQSPEVAAIGPRQYLAVFELGG